MKFLSDGHDVMAFTKDEEGRYVSFDENFSAQFGARAGFRDVDLFGDAVGLQMRERDLVALETGDTVESVYVMHTPSGEQHLLSRKTRIDGRSGRFIVGYIMNITKYTKKAAVKAMLTLVLMSMLGPGAAGFLGKKWWRGIFRDTDTPDTLSLAVS